MVWCFFIFDLFIYFVHYNFVYRLSFYNTFGFCESMYFNCRVEDVMVITVILQFSMYQRYWPTLLMQYTFYVFLDLKKSSGFKNPRYTVGAQ